MSVLKSKINLLKVVLVVSCVLTVVKFIAYYLTKSFAILSDAFESIINIAATSFALYSVQYGAKLKDADHPYGHGKIEYVAAGFEGALIFVSGIYILIEAVLSLIHGKEILNVDAGIQFTAMTSIILFLLGMQLSKKGKELNSMPLLAEGKHIYVDVITSASIIFGLLLYKLTGYIWIDGVLAGLLSLHILFSGYTLVKDSLHNLMDKADTQTIEKITAALQKSRRERWIDIHNLRLQKFGHYLHIDCHMTMPFYESLETIHGEIKILERELNNQFDNHVELFIHADPCEKVPCQICAVKDCTFRKKDFVKQIGWGSANLIQNRRHSL